MASKKKSGSRGRSSGSGSGAARGEESNGRRARLQRSDDEKIRLVRQIMASGNQSAEIKKLGIYPNQFYDWKKRFASRLGAAIGGVSRRSAGAAGSAARSVADEAKAFIEGKAALLQRLRAQREELDQLISELSS